MRRNLGVRLIIGSIAVACLTLHAHAAIIDHNCTDLSAVPTSWIEQAKAGFRLWYGHTSHGSQLTTGMDNLQSHYGQPYTYNQDGSDDALSYWEVDGDLGTQGDMTWEATTRDQLNTPGNDRNFVMWAWCGGVSENTPEGIDAYLNAMNQLESDYPGVRFVYFTGHLDGTGEEGNLNAGNNRIRDYCRANDKMLFDFADIESYDPDGNYFLNRYANDNCDYDGGNWAEEWCAAHPDSDLCWSCDCAHSQPLNCNRKARAFWWLMAVAAGWNNPNYTPTPPGTPTPTPLPGTPTPNECQHSGVWPYMPAQWFSPDQECYCSATICNSEGYDLADYAVCIVLDVHGVYFFAPDFTQDLTTYRNQMPTIPTGESTLEVVASFSWPWGAGTDDGITWYGGILDPEFTYLIGDIGSYTFGWGD